jgi:stearoyl-CoA desaturase (delta-9 desaturase)
MIKMTALGVLYGLAGGLGVTAGAHRLWTHRSYKARWPARLILMLLNCIALQNDVIEWARNHRSHHKWTDTVADPHNATRGFFFSHMGWLMLGKHPEVRRQGAKLDLSDLYADPILRFQRRWETKC